MMMEIGALLFIGGLIKLAKSPVVEIIKEIIQWIGHQREVEEQRRREQRQEEEHALFISSYDRLATAISSIAAASTHVSRTLEIEGSGNPLLAPHIEITSETVPPLGRALPEWSEADIIKASSLERAIEGRFADGLAGHVTHLKPNAEADLRQIFASTHKLAHYSEEIKQHRGILVVPVVRGRSIGPTERDTFFWHIREVAQHYNTALSDYARHAGVDSRSADRDIRMPPPLLIAPDLLASHVELGRETVARVRGYLRWCPTICLQATLGPQDAQLESWWWLRGSDEPLHFATIIPFAPFSMDAVTPLRITTGCAQTLMLLIGDMLSVGGYEGVSILSDVLRKGGLGDELQMLGPWYQSLMRAFGRHYGQPGLMIVGLQDAPPHSDPVWAPTENRAFQPPAQPVSGLLTDLRRALALRQFIPSPDGAGESGWLFQAVANPREYPPACYVLAVADTTPETALVRYWKTRAEFDPRGARPEDWQRVTRAGVEAFRLNPSVFANLCTGIGDVANRLDHLDRRA